MVRMLKIFLVVLMSIGLLACEDVADRADTNVDSNWIYGLHYEYSDLPEGYTVNRNGSINGFEVAFSDLTTVCGFHYYQSDNGDVFWIQEVDGVYKTTVLGRPLGLPIFSNENPDEFTTYPFKKSELTSVGRYVVMSNLPAHIKDKYGMWTRTNHQADPIHDNCLMIVDGANKSVKHYDHSTDTLTEVF